MLSVAAGFLEFCVVRSRAATVCIIQFLLLCFVRFLGHYHVANAAPSAKSCFFQHRGRLRWWFLIVFKVVVWMLARGLVFFSFHVRAAVWNFRFDSSPKTFSFLLTSLFVSFKFLWFQSRLAFLSSALCARAPPQLVLFSFFGFAPCVSLSIIRLRVPRCLWNLISFSIVARRAGDFWYFFHIDVWDIARRLMFS